MNLVLFNPDASVLSITLEAERLIEDALAPTTLLGVVRSASQQDEAVAAAQVMHDLVGAIKEAADEAGRPFFEKHRQIHEIKKKAIERLEAETARVNALCGDYQQLEAARLKGAIQAQKDTLSNLDRERMAERAKATSHEELDAIDLKYAELVKDQGPVVMPQVAKGQKVKPDWEYSVENPLLLATFAPQCVEFKFRDREIKDLLDAHNGILPGVKAERKLVSKVRKSRQPEAINV